MKIAGMILLCFTIATARAQTPDGQPSFEVASIKAVPPPEPGKPFMIGTRGGPGTPDPGRFTCNSCNLTMLITQAYGVAGYQLSTPGSMNDGRFDVTAKVPEGTTKDQFKLMLQNLLAERFKLTVHREMKDAQIYELVVAKGGPKMKESAEEPAKKSDDAPPPPPPGARGPLPMGKDGFPVLPPGRTAMFTGMGRARRQAQRESMEDLAKMLSNQLGKPVTDSTGLMGKYDFTLTWVGGRDGSGMAGLPPPPPPLHHQAEARPQAETRR